MGFRAITAVARLRYVCTSAGCGGCVTSVTLQGVEAALRL